MNKTLLHRGMLGLHLPHDSLVLCGILESDPDAVRFALEVPDDAFLRKLRHHLTAKNAEISMENEAPPPTQLETDEDVRRVQAELRKAAEKRRSTADSPSEEKPFRPTKRFPVAALVACDDGKDTGELFRIRNPQFIIGRSEGDFQLPHDELVSARHVAVTRQIMGGKSRIIVTDLQSRNGLFVRATKAPLAHQAEVLIGSGHYRLEIVQDTVPETTDMVGQLNGPIGTRVMDGVAQPGSVVLSEMVAGRAETKTKLDDSRYMIGRDACCEIRRAKDVYTAGQHALLTRNERGTWIIENQKTLNGVWLRVPQIIVSEGKSCEFRVGEQRFRLKFGSSQ